MTWEELKEYEAYKTPVPSYDEYWHMISCLNDQTEILNENIMLKEEYEKECKRADELEDSYWKEVEKNKKLKELLKKARDILEDEGDYMIVQKIDGELEK